MFVGRPPPEPLVPAPLAAPFGRFVVLLGVLFAVSTLTPATVGGYSQSLEALHRGRLFLYALAPLAGLLGIGVGEELGGGKTVRLAGLSALGMILTAPFLLAYHRWTGVPWNAAGMVLLYLGVLFMCFGFGGACLTAVVVLDERRFAAKQLVLALVMVGPLPASVAFSPVVAIPELWEGQLTAAAAGLAAPVGLALLSLGVMTWKAHRASSAGGERGAGSGDPFVGRLRRG